MSENTSYSKSKETIKTQNDTNKVLSANLKKGICCQLQSEGYIDTEQLVWLLNEITNEQEIFL